jgi:hypothetical protein
MRLQTSVWCISKHILTILHKDFQNQNTDKLENLEITVMDPSTLDVCNATLMSSVKQVCNLLICGVFCY